MTEPEVLVIGAGPAGTATARCLASRGRRVLVVDRGRLAAPRVGETLAAELPLFLAPLRIPLDDLLRRVPHVRSSATAVAWGSGDLVVRGAISSPYGGGWHVDRPALDAALADLATQAGAEVALGIRVTRLTREADHVCATLVEGAGGTRFVRPQLVVDASGPGGWAACALGARWTADDRLVGVAAWLEPGATAFEPELLIESAPDGWWYSAPLPDGRLVVTLMTDAEALAGRPAAARWAEALARTVRTRVRCGAPTGVPVVVRKAGAGGLDTVALPGLVAVGDAGSVFDPLAGRGVLKAFESGARAATAIDACLAGDARGLARYAARVAADLARHRRDRASFYAAEQRWPDAPFWRARRATP